MASDTFSYLALSGICDTTRGDSAHKIDRLEGPNFVQELTATRIRNQFNSRPICFAFIVNNVQSETTLMYADEEALITFDNGLIIFTLGGNTAIFTILNLVGITTAHRVQICVDNTGDTGARLYQDCRLLQSVPFTTQNIPPVSTVTLLVNQSTIFDVSTSNS